MSHLNEGLNSAAGGVARSRVFEVKPDLANSQTRPKYTTVSVAQRMWISDAAGRSTIA